jgi:hypothetical protein
MVATCTVSGIVKDVNNVAIPYAELFFSRKAFLGQDGDVIAKWQVATKADPSGLISIVLKPGNYYCLAKYGTETAEFKVAVPDALTASFAACIDAATIALPSQVLTDAQAARDAALVAQTGAQTARTGAETAQTGAETAQTGAQTARTGAETAQTGAEVAFASTLALNPFDQPVEALHPVAFALPSGWWDTGLRMTIAATSPFTTSTSILALISNWGGVHLFNAGQAGANFDMSTSGRVFGADGVTAAAVGLGVGLVSDDHRGAVLGSELVTNTWSAPGAGISYSAGVFTFDGTTSLSNIVFSTNTPAASIVVGKAYLATYRINGGTTLPVDLRLGGVLGTARTAAGTYSEILVATSTAAPQMACRTNVGARTGSIDSISIRELLIPAIQQPSTALRPLYGRAPASRRNLLRASDNYSDASWGKSTQGNGIAPAVISNAATAPDGTMTADSVVFNANGATSGDRSKLTQSANFSASVKASGSFWLRSASPVTLTLITSTGSTGAGNVSTSTTVTTSIAWTKFLAVDSTVGTTGGLVVLELRTEGNIHPGAVTVDVWGGQLEVGSVVTATQKTGTTGVSGAPLDITETGVASYGFLRPDLSDDVLPILCPTAITGDLAIMGRNGSWIEPVSIAAGATFNVGPTGTLATPGILRATGDIVDILAIGKTLTAEERARMMRKYRAEGAAGWLIEGPELIVNGDFSSGANWTTGTGWSISGGVASSAAATGSLTQIIGGGLVAGTAYRVKFTVSASSGAGQNGARVRLEGVTNSLFAQPTVTGDGLTDVVLIANSGNTTLALYTIGSDDVFNVNNVSIKALIPEAAP